MSLPLPIPLVFCSPTKPPLTNSHHLAAPHTSKAATTSAPQACLPLLAAMPSASCGRQWHAISSLPYCFVRAAQRLGNQAVVVDDGGVCSRGIDGARGIGEVLLIRRLLWMGKGLRSQGRSRPGSKKSRRRESGVIDGCARRLTNDPIDCLQ